MTPISDRYMSIFPYPLHLFMACMHSDRVWVIYSGHCDTTYINNCYQVSFGILNSPPPPPGLSPKYPDMNIIMHLSKCCLLPLSPTELWAAIVKSNRELSPEYLDTLLEFMLRRESTVLRVRGRPTRY
ncbi:hypothetical protein NPIL_412531 [Nephila pilipes]|uniref:Uncharacterized protein n=1 Tax=Nephila pilipes TaxID=299642 RepID=A0A8X6N6W7_NEPPI|nr:hypothetical protein NPIL_412531 [Nephila pilipes]